MATNSVTFNGFPLVNVVSMSDSVRGARSTGLIYFYITTLDFTGKDLEVDPRVSVLFTQEQDLSCSAAGMDPMEPTCDRIIITGRVKRLDNSTREFQFAHQAMLSRHPAAANWMKGLTFSEKKNFKKGKS